MKYRLIRPTETYDKNIVYQVLGSHLSPEASFKVTQPKKSLEHHVITMWRGSDGWVDYIDVTHNRKEAENIAYQCALDYIKTISKEDDELIDETLD